MVFFIFAGTLGTISFFLLGWKIFIGVVLFVYADNIVKFIGD
jgi:hypothetical protein